MKNKILLGIFVLIGILLFMGGIVNAATYTKDGYSIEIPDTFTSVTVSGSTIMAQKADGRTALQVTSQQEDNMGLVLTEEYLDYIIEEFKSQYGSDLILISDKLIEHNGCIGIELKYKQLESGVYIYADLYQFISDNYMYILIFGSDKSSYSTSAEKENILKSFKIKDTVISSNGIPFTDVASNAWYHEAVKYVYDNNIIKGTNAYTFAPEQNLTRAMLVTILHRMEGEKYVSGVSKFPDVQDTSAYYYVAVKWATQNNIVSGYNNGNFGPNDPITREQLAVILNKYCKYKGKYKAQTADLTKFKDTDKISSWAKWEMNWAVGAGVITGNAKDKTLNPQGTATRAEVASMLYKYCTKIK